MMGYKELIEQLRGLLPAKIDYAEMVGAEAVHYGKSYVYEDPESYIIEDTATAIETLLAERDAAISAIPKDCSKCIYWGRLKTESPCRECWYSSGPRKNWQWRGTQKADYTYLK